MYKIIFFVLFLLSSTFSLNAEIARNLKIIGNERVSDETIKVYGDVELGKNYKESDLNNILLCISPLLRSKNLYFNLTSSG